MSKQEVLQPSAEHKKTLESNQESFLADRRNFGKGSLQAEEQPEGSAAPVSNDTFEQTVTSHPTITYRPLHFSIDGVGTQGVYDQWNDYYLIKRGELHRLNQYAPIIQSTATWYMENVADSEIHYLFLNNGTINRLNVRFKKDNFLHLTGIKPIQNNKVVADFVDDFVNGNGHYDHITISRSLNKKLQVLAMLPDIIDSKSFVLNDLSSVKKMQRLDLYSAIKTKDEDLLLLFKDVGSQLIPASLMKLTQKLDESLQHIEEKIILGVYRTKNNTLEQLSINTDFIHDEGKQLMQLMNQASFEPIELMESQEELEEKTARPKLTKFELELLEEFSRFILDEHNEVWKKGFKNDTPFNPVSRTSYSSTNQLRLQLYLLKHQLIDPRFVTFQQAKEMKWKVKKGAKSILLQRKFAINKETKQTIHFDALSDEEKEELKDKIVWRINEFRVFHVSEIEGMPNYILLGQKQSQEYDLQKQFIKNCFNRMNLKFHENRTIEAAYYDFTNDSITMPAMNQFENEAYYFGTMLHELGHATGHYSRLNRALTADSNSMDYFKEELVAELNSLFMLGKLNVQRDESKHNAFLYVKHYFERLKSNPKHLLEALHFSSKAQDYLLEKGNYEQLFIEKASYLEQELENHQVSVSDKSEKMIKKNVNHSGYKKYDSNTLEQLKKIDIINYATNQLGLTAQKTGRNTINFKEHNSLMVYQNTNTFYRFSTKKGGSIIDFIAHMENVDQVEAIKKLTEYYEKNKGNEITTILKPQKEKGELKIPLKAATNKHVINYLIKRGIDQSVIQDYIQQGLVYQDKRYNCCFVEKDRNGNIQGINLRGTYDNTDFKGKSGGSCPIGVLKQANEKDTLFIAEAVIDAMSVETMYPKLTPNVSFLSINSVNNASEILEKRNEEFKDYRKIVIGLDNDDKGKITTDEIKHYFEQHYPDKQIQIHSPLKKDFNEDLQHIKNQELEQQLNEGLGKGGMYNVMKK